MEIPETWIEVSLEELGTGSNAIVDGPFGSNLKNSDYVDDPVNGVPVLTTKNLAGIYTPESVRYVTKEKFETLKRSMVTGGDILVAKIGSIGKTGIYPKGHKPALIPANLLKFTVTDKTNFSYVYNYLTFEGFQKLIRNIATATAQPAFNVTKFRKLPIPLPPLPEQHRIVAKIEELFSDLDAGILLLRKVKEQLKIYRQSVLKWAFEGKLTNKTVINGKLPEGWRWEYTKELFEYVTSGSRGWAQYYSDEGAIFLRMGNLDHGSIELDLTDIQRVKLPNKAEGTRTLVRTDDILISITADVGMIALVPENFPEAYINQHVSLARPQTNIVQPSYLAWFLAGKENGQVQLRDLQRGATKVGLGLDDIRSVKVPIPPIKEQTAIVSEIESRLSVADNLEKTIDASLSQADALRQSILKRAFEGKLVPQDPKDEPASELLKRIMLEKATKEVPQKGKRGKQKNG